MTALEQRVASLEGALNARREEGEEVREPGEDMEGGGGLDGAGNSSLDRLLMRPNASRERIEYLQIDDGTGEVHEYGPTSVFKHFPPSNASSATSARPRGSSTETIFLAAGKVARLCVPDGFDEALHGDALGAFFTFFNPWCWWVDEMRFRNDMGAAVPETGMVRLNLRTPYYSPLLHSAMLAIGVMYLDRLCYADRELISDSFARNAASFFEDEIESTKSSAVVGLMLLGTHHAGHARQNLGYIYTGAGLRLTRIQKHITVGLGVDASSWVENNLISPQTKRSRDQVWHTAYIQDKLWATYVGRAPAPNLSHWRMPTLAAEEEEDERPWGQWGSHGADWVRKSWITLTFTWTCKLSRIVELILTNVIGYLTAAIVTQPEEMSVRERRGISNPNSGTKSLASLANLDSNVAIVDFVTASVLLEKWQAELPPPLRVGHTKVQGQDASMLPHVLVMNVMSHFAAILLNRPDYCDTSRPPRMAGEADSSAKIRTTAKERCHTAA
ncbi:hypothetical protein Neosp_009058 [[Neocosmospora] mangrovei]